MFPIFNYNGKTDEVVINNEIILELECFKKVWTRKRPSKGDNDGSKKVMNKKEFMYIFFMANLGGKNPFRSLSEENRHKQAIKNCGFESHWVPDALIQECMNKYIELTLEGTPTLKFLVQAEQVVRQTGEHLEIMRKQNEKLLEAMKSTEVVDESLLLNLQNNLAMFYSLIGKVSEINSTRLKLEKIFLEETTAAELAKGGRKIGNRE